MEQNKTGRTFGMILAIMGILLLLFACAAWMSTTGQLMGFDIQGARKIAPTILGILFLAAGIGMINRN
jgi:threonine/homoserine/homoserine lactone efflux protein